MKKIKTNFNDARHISRMSVEEIAHYFELSISTVRRYKRSGKAPKAIIECLLMLGGQCPAFSCRNDFTGWGFGNGHLWSPEGDKFTSGDIRAGKLALLEQERQYRNDVRKRQKELVVKRKAKIIQFPSSKTLK